MMLLALASLCVVAHARILDGGPWKKGQMSVGLEASVLAGRPVFLRENEKLLFECKTRDLVLYQVNAKAYHSACSVPPAAKLVVDCAKNGKAKHEIFWEARDEGPRYFIGFSHTKEAGCDLLRIKVENVYAIKDVVHFMPSLKRGGEEERIEDDEDEAIDEYADEDVYNDDDDDDEEEEPETEAREWMEDNMPEIKVNHGGLFGGHHPKAIPKYAASSEEVRPSQYRPPPKGVVFFDATAELEKFNKPASSSAISMLLPLLVAFIFRHFN